MRSYTVEFTIKARVGYTDAQFSTLVLRAKNAGATPTFIIAADARRMINRQGATDHAFGTLIGTVAPGQGSKVRAD